MSDTTTHDTMVAQTEKAQELLDYFQGFRSLIDTRLNTAERRVGDTLRMFNLDQVNGDDANDGSFGAPLKTMGEVAERSVRGGITTVFLRSDYREEQDHLSLGFGALKVNLNGFKLSWSNYVDGSRAARWRFDMAHGGLGFIQLEGGIVAVGHGPDTASSFGRTFINGRGVPINLFLKSCTLEVEADPGADFSTGYLAGIPGGLFLESTTYPAAMAGRWIKDVAAATDPATLPTLTHTNLTSL